ncbi:MAG: sulfite oxidase-like oxidoreductase [Nitrospirae bacterium]|nr:MAG: sulfite oxidase-like oxidoreductase [Nitrospirota bacterium]
MRGLRGDLITRRALLVRALGGAALALTGLDGRSLSLAAPGNDNRIIRVARPQDLETAVRDLASWITPNDRFFVRSHFGPPGAGSLTEWRLQVGGDVGRPLTLTLSDVKRFEPVTMPAVVQCAGNGRAFFRPRVPGVQWERGAVGNARWTGVRLAEVLQKAGLGAKARHVQLLGADRPLLPTVPLFFRSIPIEKAMHPATLLAYEMNGEPLPLLHGAPLRLIVPGWHGDACVKWLTHLTVQEHEAEGFYMQTAYRMPAAPVQPGAAAQMVPVTELVVKSLITRPLEGAVLAGETVQVEGVAFTGEGEIVRVEVSTDEGGHWSDAELVGERAPYAWRLWRYVWKGARPGRYTVWSRATDSRGRTQPMTTPWNPSGYLWNAVDAVRIGITA